MKKLFILPVLLLVFGFANAQLQILVDDVDVSGQTLALPHNVKIHFKVKNTGGADVNVEAKVLSAVKPDGSGLMVCGFGLCTMILPSTTFPAAVGNPVSVAAGAIYGSNAEDVEYNPLGQTGLAKLTLRVNEVGNEEANHADVTFTTALANEDIDNVSLSIYPNPATDFLKINSDLTNAEISINDLLGKEIISTQLNSGINTISVQDLDAGIYVYTILSNGNIVKTDKIIVK